MLKMLVIWALKSGLKSPLRDVGAGDADPKGENLTNPDVCGIKMCRKRH